MIIIIIIKLRCIVHYRDLLSEIECKKDSFAKRHLRYQKYFLITPKNAILPSSTMSIKVKQVHALARRMW